MHRPRCGDARPRSIADPAAVGFGAADEAGLAGRAPDRVRNVSTRRVSGRGGGGGGGDRRRLGDREAGAAAACRPGAQRLVTLTARVSFLPRGLGAIEGRARLEVSGGGRIYVPWAVALPVQGSALIGGISLSAQQLPGLGPRAGGPDGAGGPGARPRRAAPAASGLAARRRALARPASGSACSPGCATCCPGGTRSGSPAAARAEGRSPAAPTGCASSRGRPTGPPRRRSIGFRIR